MSSKYTVKDLVFWTGLMGGLAVVFHLMKPLDFHVIIKYLVAGGAGLALGNAGLLLYERLNNPTHQNQQFRDDDDGPTF